MRGADGSMLAEHGKAGPGRGPASKSKPTMRRYASSASFAWAAARRAMGTRYGEQET